MDFAEPIDLLTEMKTPISKICAKRVCLLSLSACAQSVRIDDRLTYQTEAAIDSTFQPQRRLAAIVVDSASRTLIVTRSPSGIAGAMANYHFPIGATFTSYVNQYAGRIFRMNTPDSLRFSLHIVDWDVTFSNGFLAHMNGSEKQKSAAMIATVAVETHLGAAVLDTTYRYTAHARAKTNGSGYSGTEADAAAIDDIVRQLMVDLVRCAKKLRNSDDANAASTR